jgi:hypothetical protein
MLRSLLLATALGLAAGEPASAGTADSVPALAARVTITRLAADRWRVDYEFGEPVAGVVYDPPVAGYREQAWRPATPGVRLVLRDGDEALVSSDSALMRLSVEVHRHGAFAHDRYSPQVPYSDGGAALYLGFFTGRAIVAGGERPLAAAFRFVGLPGEQVLEPAGGDANAYVYFGPQRPVATEHARLVVDPGAPAWLRELLLRVGEATSRVYAERLGGGLAAAPLVLVGAGDMDAAEGLSVKGGAIGDQFVMLLQGRGLREETPWKREAVERLAAHELAHLWQLRGFPSAFNDAEPWLHEGAAEAMAVQALEAAGLWSAAQVQTFAGRAAERCRTALGSAALAEAARQGSSEAIYACGFGLWWAAGADPLSAWSRLADAVTRDGRAYTQATVDGVLAARRD